MKYLLDTNSFWNVLKSFYIGQTSDIAALQSNGKYEFFLPEIVSMEIFSVLGKYMRGTTKQSNSCDREIAGEGKCGKSWVVSAKPKLNGHESKFMRDAINSIIDNQNPSFNVKIIPLDSTILNTGRSLLQRYTPKRDLRSLDATIAAYAIEKGRTENLTVFTLDGALINVLNMEGVSVVKILPEKLP